MMDVSGGILFFFKLCIGVHAKMVCKDYSIVPIPFINCFIFPLFLDCSLCYECDAWLGSSMACMGFRVYRPELKTISDQVSKLLIFSFASLFQLPREKFLQYENRQS